MNKTWAQAAFRWRYDSNSRDSNKLCEASLILFSKLQFSAHKLNINYLKQSIFKNAGAYWRLTGDNNFRNNCCAFKGTKHLVENIEGIGSSLSQYM